MSLFKLCLGYLRAKLAERKTARAAKKPGNDRTRRNSAGPKTVMSPLSPLTTEVFEDEKTDFLEQPSASPRSTVRTSTPVSTGANFATKFASQIMTFGIVPTSNEAAVHFGFLGNSPIRSDDIQISMTPLGQPWFSRRRSSLMRLSASNMQMSECVRTPRRPAHRTHEYIPPVLDDVPVTGDGIEMEMDEFSPRQKKNSQLSSGDSVDADDNASILTFEQISFLMIHGADPFRFASSMASVSRDPLVPVSSTQISANSITNSNDTDSNKEISSPSMPFRPKLRPAPLPLPLTFSKSITKSNAEPNSDSDYDSEYESAHLTQPLPVQDHFCIISDSPLSFQSFDVAGTWPDTPIPTPADVRRTTIVFWTGTGRGSERSSVSISVSVSQGRSRPGTAGSGVSEYRSVWW